MAVTGHPHRVRLPLHFSADQPDNEPGKRAPVRRVHHALIIKHKLLSRNDPVTNSTKGKVNRSRLSLTLRTSQCTKHPCLIIRGPMFDLQSPVISGRHLFSFIQFHYKGRIQNSPKGAGECRVRRPFRGMPIYNFAKITKKTAWDREGVGLWWVVRLGPPLISAWKMSFPSCMLTNKGPPFPEAPCSPGISSV